MQGGPRDREQAISGSEERVASVARRGEPAETRLLPRRDARRRLPGAVSRLRLLTNRRSLNDRLDFALLRRSSSGMGPSRRGSSMDSLLSSLLFVATFGSPRAFRHRSGSWERSNEAPTGSYGALSTGSRGKEAPLGALNFLFYFYFFYFFDTSEQLY
jgi:hypothetical protein